MNPVGDPYEISLDPTRVDVERVHGWLRESYWSPKVRRDVVERAIENSIVASAFEIASEAQVGIARIITDQATFAWLCDVYVDEAHRGRGISQRMLTALIADPRLQGLRRWMLGTRDAHELYRKVGFVPLVDPTRWMEWRPPMDGWQERD